MLAAATAAAGASALVVVAGGSAPARGLAPAPPTAATGPASDVHVGSARLTGTVTPNGLTTTYRFEYGRTAGYGSATRATDAGSGTAPVRAVADVGGLAPGTVYHYRLVATNRLGTAFGADATVTTRDPRLRGRYRVRLRVAGGGAAFGERRGDVFHRTYRFRPRCQGPLCRAVKLKRRGRRGHFRSTLRRASSGVYTGTERFRRGRCDDGLTFHTAAPIRVAVKRTAGDRAARIRGKLRVRMRGCRSGGERARMRGRAKG